jgi:hypothetical protein
MANWKDELAVASRERTLKRARGMIGKGIRYKLGKGGMDPTKALKDQSDCSGFAAWAIGIPRQLPPGTGTWLQTTTYWKGGGSAADGLFDAVSEYLAEPGDIVVYPDRGRKQGHMGIVSALDGNRVSGVIHCSSGNDRRFGDAIQDTAPDVFQRVAKTRYMRVDYPALRGLFNLPEPADGTEEAVETPFVDSELDHPVFAGDETMRLVSRGELILEATGNPVVGCRALHDALNLLGKRDPRYQVALGSGKRWHGYYGSKTKKAVKNFQRDNDIATTGELDAVTLLRLDNALTALPG